MYEQSLSVLETCICNYSIALLTYVCRITALFTYILTKKYEYTFFTGKYTLQKKTHDFQSVDALSFNKLLRLVSHPHRQHKN
jgi:hypothetical protein